MSHQEITDYVGKLKIAPLTKSNYGDFVLNVRKVFKTGRIVINYYQYGLNEETIKKHDFSKGAPDWKRGKTGRCEIFEEKNKGKKGRFVTVKGQDLYEMWGYRPRLTLFKFAFDPGKALYVIDEKFNGTPEFPYRDLFLAGDV